MIVRLYHRGIHSGNIGCEERFYAPKKSVKTVKGWL